MGMPEITGILRGTDRQILELNSDALAYKQAGNGVTVNVIEAIEDACFRFIQSTPGIHILQ